MRGAPRRTLRDLSRELWSMDYSKDALRVGDGCSGDGGAARAVRGVLHSRDRADDELVRRDLLVWSRGTLTHDRDAHVVARVVPVATHA